MAEWDGQRNSGDHSRMTVRPAPRERAVDRLPRRSAAGQAGVRAAPIPSPPGPIGRSAARVLLALLLALALWPPTLAAADGASRSEPARLEAVDSGDGRGLLRSPGGLELLRVLESRGSGGSGSESRSPGPHPLERGPGWVRAHAPSLGAPVAAEVDRIVSPLCERLPYHATAPPSPR